MTYDISNARAVLGYILLLVGPLLCAPVAMAAEPERPNIVLVLVDNLGWGELGAYGGGVLRGTPTPRLDRLATEGLRLTNFNVETECVQAKSDREGVLIYVNGDLHAAKWRDWKLHFWWQLEPQSGKDSLGAVQLEVPYLFNVLSDPQEDTDVGTANSWVVVPVSNMTRQFQASLRKYPPIPPGTPDPYNPPASTSRN